MCHEAHVMWHHRCHYLLQLWDMSQNQHHLVLYVQAYKDISRAHPQHPNHSNLRTLVLVLTVTSLQSKFGCPLEYLLYYPWPQNSSNGQVGIIFRKPNPWSRNSFESTCPVFLLGHWVSSKATLAQKDS